MKLIQKSYKLISLLLILLPAFVFAEKSTPIDLTKWFNNDAIASESKINDGSFDTGGYTFPKEQMPASGAVTFKKINFIFPSYKDSEKNNIQCKGQTITLPALKADTIYFLGASEGKSYSENFNLTYTDGTEDAVKVGLSDWCVEPVYNESSAIKSAFRYTGKEKDPVACNIWIQKVQVPHPEKTLLKMILSATPGMHIFSISLAGGTTGQPGDQKIVALPENIVSVTKDGKLILDNTFNCKGFTSKNNLQAGNFDGGGFSFPSEELKEKISSENIDFNIKSSNSANDNIKCDGQNLNLKGALKGTILGIAGSAEYGNFADTITVIYTDKEKTVFDFGLTDWCGEIAQYGEKPLIQFSCRYSPTGPEDVKAKIWFSKITLKNKPIDSIILPNKEHMHIFGMTVK